MKTWLKDKIKLYFPEVDFDILIPPTEELGDYSTNIAFKMAETQVHKEKPEEIAKGIIAKLKQDKELINVFEKIEVVRPGFINFYLSNNFLKKSLVDIIKNDKYGFNETMRGKTVMVEYTDPNPFKLFHIGHLMSNTIGESIARLYEASGAKVLRANYQGDVGLHVAKAIWGMLKQNQESKINNLEKWNMDRIGQAYAAGAKAYEENENARKEIEDINVKIYDRSDEEINKAYDLGRKLSLDYFETIYKKLGTKFDRYFFESEAADDGLKIVKEHPEVFVESEGAKVFKGERYGLHTRVFVNSQGLPTYEAKELGVNKKKFDQDKLDLSIIITGNEINEYFKVLLKVMELTIPEVAKKTKHISHGMLRLPGGKMSSRTGEIITVELLIEQVKSKLPESETDEIKDKIAISAIKYSILKQSPGRDIIFDFEKSLSVKGDSAPYLQYTYARLRSILDKYKKEELILKNRQKDLELDILSYSFLEHKTEFKLIKQFLKFPDVVKESKDKISPQHLAFYLYELANDTNRFYEAVPILKDKNNERKIIRLALVETVASIFERGLNILGISVLNKI